MLLTVNALLVISLFICSSFMAGSEAAITSLSKYRIRKIVALRKHLQEFFTRWLHSPQDFMITILISDTFITMFLSIFATYFAVSILEKSSFMPNRASIEFSAYICITVMVLIFCELMPKIFGRSYPERTTIAAIRVISVLNKILKPLILPVLWLIKRFSRGEKPVPANLLISLTIEDIRRSLGELMNAGAMGYETTRMLDGVLKISRKKVKDVMVPASKLSAVDISVEKGRIVERLTEAGYNRVPVYSGDKSRIIGVVLLKDLISPKKGGAVQFSEDLIRPVITVSPLQKVRGLLYEFQKGTTHCAAVVDRGILKGMVMLDDILKEIVGEILDEYDLAKRRSLGSK